MTKERILEILEGAKDKTASVPMSLVRKAFENISNEQHWIPVDLRNNSPEENKVVLLGVRFRDDFKYFVTSRQDYNYWTGLGREIKGELRWQPLPSPYQPEE